MALTRLAARFLYLQLLTPDLFETDISIERIKALFSQHVKLVEVENHSFCNRVCSFCPNAELDRRSRVIEIDNVVFMKIIDDLASIGYDQTLVWARYHEPLAHDSILERLKLARRLLPRAFLTFTSNGDYMDREKLQLLEEAGLDHMWVNIYPLPGKEQDPHHLDDLIAKFIRRTGLQVGKPLQPNRWRMDGTKIELYMGVTDFSNPGLTMSSRGGLLKSDLFEAYHRTAVCFSPLHHVAIDYNGKVMLCCQVRSDAPEHASAVIGQIGLDGYGLFDAYRALAAARKALTAGGAKEGVCRTCTQNLGGPYKIGRVVPLSGLLRHIPGVQGTFHRVLEKRKAQRRYENMT